MRRRSQTSYNKPPARSYALTLVRSLSMAQTDREKCCEIRGENWGELRNMGEGLKRHSPGVDTVFGDFSGNYVLGLK